MKFVETIIRALMFWVKENAFTRDEALDLCIETGYIQPMTSKDGAIYTSSNGIIYTL